jgi:hypothetical protein
MVQSALTLAWTFYLPPLQKSSPANLVSTLLSRLLGTSISEYTFVDFCAGAGGPTPFIERELNRQLKDKANTTPERSNGITGITGITNGVKFVLTDLHPHIEAWTEAASRSENLAFVADGVDAANAPTNLLQNATRAGEPVEAGTEGRKVFRLYNLAFHHFNDDLGGRILENTLDTADGFG